MPPSRFLILPFLLSALVAASALLRGGGAEAATTERVSVSSDEAEATLDSNLSAISADGRFVAFMSWAPNLVPDDTNAAVDVFVRDRQLGTTERVSVSNDEAQANGNYILNSAYPEISADGRFVAFISFASNLVATDTNDSMDIFVRDRELDTTERVSVDSDGAQGNNGSYYPAISADGRFVAFRSYASNLVPDDTNADMDIFVRDRALGTIERVSLSSDEAEANGKSDIPAMSADGRFVAFQSWASNLVPAGPSGGVFVRDRAFGTTEYVGGSSLGGDGAGPAINADGRFVAFQSSTSAILVRDRQLGTTEPVGDGDWPGISADGRFVTFTASTTPFQDDVFVRDRGLGTTERVSADTGGAQADRSSNYPEMSADGRFVAFMSEATNLVSDDTNNTSDVFVRSFDDDSDLVHEHDDNCPTMPNPNQSNVVHPVTVLGDACEDPEPDGAADADDNCPDTPNANQANNVHPGTPSGDACDNPDGDPWMDVVDGCPDVSTAWQTPPDDNPDCDGFPRTTQQGMRGPESFIGTNPDLACGVNAWPVDIDNDHEAGLSDILRYIPVFNTNAPPPASAYNPRFDLNADNKIGLSDILMFIPFFNITCTP
ncbi:MAG: thrombospondin type 3 repeat-containing protein [Dehalococcoidia bacterium]|nr:thrombospondin type 3 repeat-containing protein [Dehalococcoidia bacterium]